MGIRPNEYYTDCVLDQMSIRLSGIRPNGDQTHPMSLNTNSDMNGLSPYGLMALPNVRTLDQMLLYQMAVDQMH